MTRALTVGQLRAALVDVPDEMEVCLRISDSEGTTLVGGLTHAGQDTGCTEISMMTLDGETNAESLDDSVEG